MTSEPGTYEFWIIATFIVGYFLITIEHTIKINKATIALMMGIICWVIQFANSTSPCSLNLMCLGEHVANISQVVFFLLGALTIVEIISAHKGFNIITRCINISSKRKMLWMISILAFFMSAVLDNLTTTIVMVSLVTKLVDEFEDRILIGGGIVIAANAGGAWTPIGDVTTTMLWIGGQLSTFNVIRALFLPSLVCLVFSIGCLSFLLKGNFKPRENVKSEAIEPMGEMLFFLGIAVLVFVPVFKILTGLPPFMGVLFGLSVLWLVTDIVHRKYDERNHLRVPEILAKIDLSGVLFFLGILLAIDALDAAKILEQLAHWFDKNIGNTNVIAMMIGLGSAIVDNVPLVAATMGMYSLEQFPQDHQFWELVAYCAGTGGSILIIGSAAGVVFMGMEKVTFFWYIRKISLPALIGYFAGIGAYLLF